MSRELMDFLNLPGVLPAIIGFIAALGWWIRHDGVRRSREQEARHQKEMTQLRSENAETMAFFKLLNEQANSLHELANAIKEQNTILLTQGKRHDDSMTRIAENTLATIQLNEKIADLITGFQSFSREQHAMTRGAVAQSATDTIESIREAVNESVERITADIAAVAKDVQEVKRIVEGIKPCPDELFPKLDSIEIRLISLQQSVNETPPKLDITPPPDIVPPAAEPPAA